MTTEEAIKDLLGAEGFDPERCDVCGWRLQATMAEGCTLGSCSYRDDRFDYHSRQIKARQAMRHLVTEARWAERVLEWANDPFRNPDGSIAYGASVVGGVNGARADILAMRLDAPDTGGTLHDPGDSGYCGEEEAKP